jgi:hypothetical protein
VSAVEFWLDAAIIVLAALPSVVAAGRDLLAVRRERREAHERWRQIVRADFAQIRREMDEAMADETTTATRPAGGDDE